MAYARARNFSSVRFGVHRCIWCQPSMLSAPCASLETTRKDIKRELGIKLFGEETETGKSGARMIKKACAKCGNPELEYTTRQMRSADEGHCIPLLSPL